jgi:hypothetical protein
MHETPLGEKHTILGQHLARHDLLVEEGLALLDAGGEALILCVVDQCLDGVALPPGGSICLFLLSASLSALVSP